MLLFNRYEYNPQTNLIGKGGFSRVYKALDKKLNISVALKIYKTNELSERYSPIAEIQRVAGLDHPNISRYIDIQEIEKEDSFGQVEKIQVCVMELLEGGNFAKYYNMHPDLDVFKKLLIDVLHGLSYLHRNGIIHRDIKPANILIKQNLDGPVAKITDFGISKRSDASANSSSSALIVSIPYMAPEQLNAQKYGIDEKVHYNIDLWSLGVAVYEIITGEVLFKMNEHDSSEQIMNNIVAPELPEKIKSLPQPFKEFVLKCIIKDAKERVKTAEELIWMLQPYPQETTRVQQPAKNANQQETASLVSSPLQNITTEERVEENSREKPVPRIQPVTAVTEIEDTVILKPNRIVDEEISLNDTNSADETRIISNRQELLPKLPVEDEIPQDDDTRVFNIPDPPANHNPETIAERKEGANEEDTKIIQIENVEKQAEPAISTTQVKDDAETKIITTANNDKRDVTITAEFPENTTDDTKLISDPVSEKASEPVTAPAVSLENNIGNLKNEAVSQPKIEETVLLAKPTTDKEHPKVTLFNRYDYYPVTDMIGKGGFSRVYKAFDQKLSRWVALKIYKTSEFSDRYSPIAEIKRVVNLDHSNICRYLDIEEIEKINPFGEVEKIQVCVMELMDSGNFLEFFNKSGKDLGVLKKLLTDVLQGISYLHKNGIIHRDIKPANILIKKTIEGPVAKITDFGISKVSDSVNNNSSSALIVSIPYMAPEQLNTKKYGINEKISFNLDLWSLGVTIYEVITGKVLFKNSDQDSSEQIMANIMAPDLPEKINELPHPFKEIVSYCIVKNANHRAQKAEELLVLLNTTRAETALVPVPMVPAEPPKEKTAIAQPAPAAVEYTKQPEPAPVTLPPQEPVVKKKFIITEELPEKEKRVKKHISVLSISVAAAAVVLIVAALLYFNINNKEKEVAAAPVLNDTIRSSTVANSSNQPGKTVTAPVEDKPVKKTETGSGEVAPKLEKKATTITEKSLVKREKKNETTAKADEVQQKEPNKRVSSEKYLLNLSAAEQCQITKNGAYMGQLYPGKPYQLSLVAGSTYTIAATSTTGETFSTAIDVTEDMAGRRGTLRIKFP